MVISEISIKGFRSFGNNEQVLKLNTDGGELILLVGKNGSGKSSLIDSFDFVIFGKVRGKRKKWAILSSLVNRINGEMLNKIKFTSNGVNVEIRRGISPNVLELIENGIVYNRAGKSNIDDRIIEKYVKMDVETFKSFISMSINDFKNFISLSNEEKNMLLDNLFNMDIINKLNELLKDVIKNNKIQIAKLESEINTLNNSIKSINESIDKIKKHELSLIEKNIEDKKNKMLNEIENIKTINNKNNEKILLLSDKLNDLKNKKEFYLNKLNDINKKMYEIENKISIINKEIILYENGVCPTCKTNLKEKGNYVNIKNELKEKYDKYNLFKKELYNNIEKIKNNIVKIDNISNKMNDSFNKTKYEILYNNKKIKEICDEIKNIDGINDEYKSLNYKLYELNNTINEMEKRRNECNDLVLNHKNREFVQKELLNIISTEGVKKEIIKNIIKPINHFISENIKCMDLNYSVELNDEFDAEIKYLNEIIDNDSLSTGEIKKINIAILIAYLKMLRTKKFINVLFLDEVFSSIDEDGIKSILMLLKEFSREYKINIFVVNHEITNHEMFDKIIFVKKDVFTTLNVIDNVKQKSTDELINI